GKIASVLFPPEIDQLLRLQIVVFPVPDVYVCVFEFHQCGVFHPWDRCDAKKEFLAIFAEPDVSFSTHMPSLRHTVGGTGSQDKRTVLAWGVVIELESLLERFFWTLVSGKRELDRRVIECDVLVSTLSATDMPRLLRCEIIIV